MAKIRQGILGGFSGSVANVVGSSWKGIAVMKAKPLSVANPRTVAQVAQRTKFKAGVEWATKVKSAIIKPFWDADAQYMTGVNAWMSDNVQHYNADGTIDQTLLVMSKGSIGAIVGASANFDIGNTLIHVAWSNAVLPINASITDLTAFVVGDKNGVVVAQGALNANTRDDEDLEFPVTGLNVDHASATLHLIFKSADGVRQSVDTIISVDPAV